jgi:hypothetical protein
MIYVLMPMRVWFFFEFFSKYQIRKL